MATTQFKPSGLNIMIEALQEDAMTSGGIMLPDTAEKKNSGKGIVRAVGPGKEVDGKLRSPEVQQGDTIFYSKYAGNEINLKSGSEIVKYLIIREEDILGVLLEG